MNTKHKLTETLKSDGLKLVSMGRGYYKLVHLATGKIVAEYRKLPDLCREWGIS